MRKNTMGTRSAVLAIAGAAVGLVTLMEDLRSQVSVSNADLSTGNARRQRFSHNGTTKDEGPAAFFDRQGRTDNAATSDAAEAPAGFDNLTNGLTPQGP